MQKITCSKELKLKGRINAIFSSYLNPKISLVLFVSLCELMLVITNNFFNLHRELLPLTEYSIIHSTVSLRTERYIMVPYN